MDHGLEKAFGQCRFCLNNGFHKNLKEPCERNGVPKLYSELFLDCFDLLITTDSKLLNLICASCICRLSDAVDFKTTVYECQQRRLNKPVFIYVPNLGSDVNVKIEPKEEPPDFDEAVDNAKAYGQCCCCLNNGFHKHITEHCDRNGAPRLYTELFQECFNIYISTNIELTNLICTSCICQLRDAMEFKSLVVQSEQQLFSRNTGGEAIFIDVPKLGSEMSIKIEPEEIKDEPPDYNEDIDDNGSPPAAEPKSKNDIFEKYQIVTEVAIERDKPSTSHFNNADKCKETNVKIKKEYVLEAPIEIKKENVIDGHTEIKKENVLEANIEIEKENVIDGHTEIKIENAMDANIEIKKENYTKTGYRMKSIKSKDNLLVERANRSFACNQCRFTTGKRNLYKSHLEAHSSATQFICDICFYITTKKSRIINHLRVHSGEMPYSCVKCEKKFNNLSNFRTHIKLHDSFFCDVCNLSFTHKYIYSRHAETHTDGKPFPCQICGRSFRRRAGLNVHLKAHTDEKPFSCQMCDKKFATNAHLKDHVRIHTDERPFSCGMCEKRFRQRFSLVEHVRIHTDEKPYACGTCGKTFRTRSNLKSHERNVHEGERAFACQCCDKSYTRQRALDNHLRKQHSINV